MRDSTERPETVEVGSNVLVGTSPDAIVEGAEGMLDASGDWSNPFGDGSAAERILDVMTASK
jgi:UDP-N-acetylglucosamine 2-epimerase (non-hydrolysing)